MKHPIDGLEAFIRIAELGSFNKAAEKLNVTQTALTHRIQRLESHVGLKLLDRTTRVVSLTTVGRSFLPEAVRLVEEFERSIDRLRKQSRYSMGDVVISSIPSVMFGFLPLVLSRYTQEFPENKVEIIDRTSVLVIESVQRRQSEFGLHVHPRRQTALHSELLCREPLVAYCRRDHPLAGRSVVHWSDLSEFDLISLGGTSGNRLLMEVQLMQAGIDIRTKFVVEYFSSAIGLATQGLGVAILVAGSAINLNPNVVQIPLIDPVIERPLFLIKRQGETLTPAAQRLYEMIQSYFESPPPVQPAELSDKSD